MKRAATVRVVGQVILVDAWTGGGRWWLEKEGDSKKRREEKERGGTGGEERKRGEFSLRGLGEKKDSLVGCLGGRIAVRFLAHLAGESYLEVRLLCILHQLLLVCFSTLFLLILGWWLLIGSEYVHFFC